MSGYQQQRRPRDASERDDRFAGSGSRGRPQTRNDRPPLEWDTIGILRQHDQDRSPACKLTMTKTGPVRVSYTLGVMDQDAFRPLQHLPDRDITQYLELLQDAATRVGEIMRSTKKDYTDPHGLRVSLGEVVRVR